MKNILCLFIFMIPLGIQAQTVTEALPPDPLPSGVKLLYITKEKDQNKIKIHWSFDSNYVANNSTFEFSVSLENHYGQTNYTIQKSVLLDYDSAIHFNDSFDDAYNYNYPHYPDSNSAAFRSVEISLFHEYYVHDLIYNGEIITKINYRNQFPHLFEDFEKAYPRFMRLVNDIPSHIIGGVEHPIIHNWSLADMGLAQGGHYPYYQQAAEYQSDWFMKNYIVNNLDLNPKRIKVGDNFLGSCFASNGASYSMKNKVRMGYIEMFPSNRKNMLYSVDYYSYTYLEQDSVSNIKIIVYQDNFGQSHLYPTNNKPIGYNISYWYFANIFNYNSFYWRMPIDSIPEDSILHYQNIHGPNDSIAYIPTWSPYQPVDNFKYLRHYSDTLCAGVGLEINGQWINQSGLYIDSMLTTWGTDSIVARSVHFLPSSYTDTTSVSICSGDSVLFMGDYYASGGVYHKLPTSGNCDSVFFLDLKEHYTHQIISKGIGNVLSLDSALVSYNYQWYNAQNHQAITGATNYSYTATQNGFYYLKINNGNCETISNTIEVKGIGVEEIDYDLSNILIYPNPFENSIIFEQSTLAEKLEVKIYKVNSQLIKSYVITSNKQEIQLDIPSGIYLIEMDNGRQKLIRKIVRK